MTLICRSGGSLLSIVKDFFFTLCTSFTHLVKFTNWNTSTVQQIQRPQHYYNWAATCEFQQCGILTSVDSNEPVQPPFKLRNSKCCSVSSLTLIEYSSDKQRLWSDCMYAQAGLSLCWSQIPHCWKSHVVAQYYVFCCLEVINRSIRIGNYDSELFLYNGENRSFRNRVKKF